MGLNFVKNPEIVLNVSNDTPAAISGTFPSCDTQGVAPRHENKTSTATCKKKEAICVLSIIILGLLFFYKTIYFGFVNFDDAAHTSENLAVINFDLQSLLLKPDTGLYHPLTTLSFAIDWWLGGSKPWIFHLNNFILHLLSSLILLKICLRLWGNKYILAFLVSLTFLLHPLKAESVVWITERKDLLSGLFLWLTIYIYLFYLDNKRLRFFILANLTFLLALASKASVVTLAPLLLVIDWYRLGRLGLSSFINKIPFVTMAIIFGVINVFAQTPYLNVPRQNYFDIVYRIQFYLERFLFPWNLRFWYSNEYLGFNPLGVGSILLLSFLTFYILKKAPEHKKNLLLGWSLFGFILLPYIKLVPFGDEYIVNDRYMYNALTGLTIAFFPFILQSIEEFWRNQRRFLSFAISGVFTVLVIQWLHIMHLQIPVWKNPTALWHHQVTLEPNSEKAAIIYGRVLLDTNRLEEALPYLQKHKGKAEDYANLGNALYKLKKLQEAEYKIQDGLKLYPTDPLLLNMLGVIRLDQARAQEALTLFTQALQNIKNKSDIRLRSVLLNQSGLANMRLGNSAIAESFFRESLAIYKNDDKAMSNLGHILLKQNRLDEAKKTYLQALKLNPSRAETHNMIGVIFYLEKNFAEARTWLNRSIKIDPNSELAKNILNTMDIEQH